MEITYEWADGGARRTVDFVRVEGTQGQPFRFGEGKDVRALEVRDTARPARRAADSGRSPDNGIERYPLHLDGRRLDRLNGRR